MKADDVASYSAYLRGYIAQIEGFFADNGENILAVLRRGMERGPDPQMQGYMIERERLVTERERNVTERERNIIERERIVTERKSIVAERESIVTEREWTLQRGRGYFGE